MTDIFFSKVSVCCLLDDVAILMRITYWQYNGGRIKAMHHSLCLKLKFTRNIFEWLRIVKTQKQLVSAFQTYF